MYDNYRITDLDYFRVFGCKCYVLNDRDNLGKFEPKSDECIFIGYSHNSKTYRVFNKRTRTILESSNVDFSETETYSDASPSNLNALLPELSTAPPSTDSASNTFASDFIDLADYDLPTLTGPIVVPAQAGSTTTSVSSDAFVTEPSSSTSTNSVTPESAVSSPEISSAASPEPVREQMITPKLYMFYSHHLAKNGLNLSFAGSGGTCQDETMDEQSDDDFWEDFERILHEGHEEETLKENQSPIQLKVSLPISDSDSSNNEPLPCQDNPRTIRYEGVLTRDPFWETSCQKQLVNPTPITTYLKDLRSNSRDSNSQSANQQSKNRNGKWYATRPGGSHKGKSTNPGFPNRNTRAEISAQIFRLGICTFSESENPPFLNRKTLFSESENEPLIWGFASEKSLFRIQAFFRTQTFPNREIVFSESEKLFSASNQVSLSRRSVLAREMSKEILGIGSETRPPVLVMGEYQQCRRRMIYFLDLLDENLMKSIREGPIRPTVTVAAVPKTDTCPELPSYVVEKPVEMFNPEQRARHLIDKRALTLLIMALPNDMYARVDSLTNARDVWLEIEQQMQGGDTAVESQKESALNAYEGFKARENESLTESYQRLNAFVNDLRRLGVEKSKYEVNVKFLKNLTQEWQNMAINIQLSRNLGAMGLHDLFSMMVQHEEFITGGRTKKAVDPLALSAVPFGGPSTTPVQPMPFNNISPQYYPEEYSQEFNPNYGTSIQHPDEPVIISISDDELFHVNESLALISHSVQRLNANRGYNRARGSGFLSGGRMGQSRGGHYQPERGQYGNQGRGSYQQGVCRLTSKETIGTTREGSEKIKADTEISREETTPILTIKEVKGYEIGYGGRHESGRLDQGPGYGYEQHRGDQRQDERMDHGKSIYHGGDSKGNSSRQVQRNDQQPHADQGIQQANHPQGPITQNPAPQQTASPTTTCYKCGKLGHYARDCSVKYKDAAYFERKASLMRKKEKRVALLVDEENWVCEEESSDEEDHMVKGLCLMADFEGSEAVGPSTYQDIDPSEVSSIPDMTDTVAMLESKICDLERCLQSERTLVTKFRIDSAIYKDSLEDLTIVYNRETLESGIRESNLANKLSCLQKAYEELNSNHGELNIKFQLLSDERTRLFSKIQELEDNNFKRGQSEQTLSILTQHAKKNPFYKAKPGLGLSENHVLDKAPSHLYNFEDMATSKPKPALVGGHVTEEFVRQTVTYIEVINGETITRIISPTNSTSSSPPTSPPPNRPIFVPASDPTNSEPTWEGIKARTPRVAMPPINYTNLNSSYDTREMELSEETLVIHPRILPQLSVPT
ncbi:hypothetical protein OSB04_002946 [Centaurea solstitialis]|uniref:CCHC-type domain-containing protein n=1 Tax=Centaurea solstitialis TaxID=347529 RepID=A0AA38U5M3_9ASTR|nr:hypothetical protein OSB04_002946 [Centaurea solstitialis]